MRQSGDGSPPPRLAPYGRARRPRGRVDRGRGLRQLRRDGHPDQAPTAPPSPTSTAQPTPSPDAATVYAEIERQVQQIRGLEAKKPVTPALLDEVQLKRNMTAQFDKDTPPAVVAATEKLYQLLGLIPAGSSLRDLYVQLLGSQVAGYYDPETKELYVVSSTGGLGPTERFVFSHEFDHALQDQNFDLKNLGLDSIGQGDAALAHLSVAEGDATLLMTLWAQSNMTPAEMLAMATDPVAAEQMQILDKMPVILRETLMFPYTSGLQMVTDAYSAGGWEAVDALYKKPPASTEQVLHADKYAAGEAPLEVAFPKDLAKRLGSGWSVELQDTLGEFQLDVLAGSERQSPRRPRRRRPQAGVATASRWSRTGIGPARSSTPAGTAPPTRPSSRPRPSRRSTRSAAITR